MKIVLFVVTAIASLNIFASECTNLSGVYQLQESCQSSTYSSKSMLYPHNKTLGIINVGENLTIEQTSCDEVSLSNEVIGADGKVYVTKSTFNDKGVGNSVDADSSSVSITFDGSNLPTSVYKGNAEIVQTSTGVNFAMESSTWNLIFQPAGSKASNSCALVRVK